jgi:hypothetical protein
MLNVRRAKTADHAMIAARVVMTVEATAEITSDVMIVVPDVMTAVATAVTIISVATAVITVRDRTATTNN